MSNSLMKKHSNDKGFTLVELAVVMTVIGLIIGGILKGQELIEGAKTNRLISDINSYDTAAMTFMDSYGAIPGDFDQPLVLPSCANDYHPCGHTNKSVGNDNGILGKTAAALTGSAPSHEQATDYETAHFWTHLHAAQIIDGIEARASNQNGNLTDSDLTVGNVFPEAPLGSGGLVIGYNVGNSLEAVPTENQSGHWFMLRGNIGLTDAYDRTDRNHQAVSPSQAFRIDTKMDDGIPNRGSVMVPNSNIGGNQTCYVGATNSYNGSNTIACAMYFLTSF